MYEAIKITRKGIYCPAGDFYIDPTNRAVKNAVVTHAHSDHARGGHENYFAHRVTAEVMKLRIGKNINIKPIEYHEDFYFNNVKVTLFPAGHIPGSAQVRVEVDNQVWVVTGDYKLNHDSISIPNEKVECDYLITESTFGMPIFQWKKQEEVFSEINNWWKSNLENGITSILMGYSLGKAQRILQGLDKSIGEIYVDKNIYITNEVLRDAGIKVDEYKIIESGLNKNSILIAPPSILNTSVIAEISNHSVAFASGWMRVEKMRSSRNMNKGFVISDHCDWNELNESVKRSKAKKIYVTHGYSSIFSRWLNEKGFNAVDMNKVKRDE